jgi:excisionase family DNA binding protein
MSDEAYAPVMSRVNPNLPEDFPKPAVFWASYFGVTVETVRRWPQEHGIPYHFLGREKYIRPSDLMARLPQVVPGIQPEPE